MPDAVALSGQAPQIVFDAAPGKARADLKPGVIDHMAFTATDLPATAARLAERGIKYDLRRLAGKSDGIWQLFFDDPNGARVEFDFDASEAAPA